MAGHGMGGRLREVQKKTILETFGKLTYKKYTISYGVVWDTKSLNSPLLDMINTDIFIGIKLVMIATNSFQPYQYTYGYFYTTNFNSY